MGELWFWPWGHFSAETAEMVSEGLGSKVVGELCVLEGKTGGKAKAPSAGEIDDSQDHESKQ